MKDKKLIETICLAMIAIMDNCEDVVWTPLQTSVGTGSTMCEDLAQSLSDLGVHEPHIEDFFELDLTDDYSKKLWVKTCIANPGPEA